MLKSIQFELWTECNVGCRYCYLGKRIRHTSEEDKLIGIRRARSFLDSGEYGDYDIIAFIGGEFLQGQLNTFTVYCEFFDLMEKAVKVIKAGKLKGIWVSASMTEHTAHLLHLMGMFNTVESEHPQGGAWLITSYDNKYRFTEKTLKTWRHNMLLRKVEFPNVKVNTCSILTQNLIEEYNAGGMTFEEFMETYGTNLYLKPPYLTNFKTKEAQEKRMPGFFPKRKDFLKFLAKVYNQEETYIFDKICNIKFRADALMRSNATELEFREKDTTYEIKTEALLPCGHPRPYNAYIDSDACMLCDKHRLAF